MSHTESRQYYLDEGLGITHSHGPGSAALAAQPVSQHRLAACNSLRRLELTIFVSPDTKSCLSLFKALPISSLSRQRLGQHEDSKTPPIGQPVPPRITEKSAQPSLAGLHELFQDFKNRKLKCEAINERQSYSLSPALLPVTYLSLNPASGYALLACSH